MNYTRIVSSTLFGMLILTAAGCGQQAEAPQSEVPYEQQLRLALETAKTGDVIVIPEGTFQFDRSLTLNTDGVTIRGAGMDRSVLSFKGQVAGAEGLLVNASDFTIEDVGIEDAKGDALKVNEGRNIIIRRVRTEWTNGPATTNGAYGIYPVQTENTLVDASVAIGASDAGIYVGQSRNVVVRNSRAEYNVAGIEIENTIDADVYDNVAKNNTGGILVFNMPDLPQEGHSTRVFRNEIVDNNIDNFAAEGTAVSGVPPGSGLLINSNDKVEIFSNNFQNNNTANILISSFYSSSLVGRKQVDGFDPFPEQIYIYANNFTGGGQKGGRDYLEALRVSLYGENGRLPDIIWDGIVRAPDANPGICVNNGSAVLLNVDAANEFAAPSSDMTLHQCENEQLPGVTLTGV